MEDEAGVHIYPKFATVTYLSELGGPTIICDKIGTQNKTEDPAGQIHQAAISKTLFGKHIKFDGRLFHGAPASIFEQSHQSDDDSSDNSDDDSCDGSCDPSMQRITFLVNIWLDHLPIQSARLPSSEVAAMTKFASDKKQTLVFNEEGPSRTCLVDVASTTNTKELRLHFCNGEEKYAFKLPIPTEEAFVSTADKSDVLILTYTNASCTAAIERRSDASHIDAVQLENFQPADSQAPSPKKARLETDLPM